MKPEIKICGLTSALEVEFLKKANVEYAGIVLFFEKSKRNISCEKAREIINELKKIDSIKVVAVVVSPSVLQVKEIEELGFDIIQIHGDLSQEVLEVIQIPVLRAINVNTAVSIEDYINEHKIIGILFDGKVPGAGKTFDWSKIKDIDKKNKLLILAGGLEEENVIEAINTVKPDVVDVSSGVEYIDGGIHDTGKDPERIKKFVSAVRNLI